MSIYYAHNNKINAERLLAAPAIDGLQPTHVKQKRFNSTQIFVDQSNTKYAFFGTDIETFDSSIKYQPLYNLYSRVYK